MIKEVGFIAFLCVVGYIAFGAWGVAIALAIYLITCLLLDLGSY